jgi:hypothetical protein
VSSCDWASWSVYCLATPANVSTMNAIDRARVPTPAGKFSHARIQPIGPANLRPAPASTTGSVQVTARELSGHNGPVTAIAWSLVGLMAASLGVLSAALYSGLGRIDGLGARIDAQGAHLGTRIDAQGASLGARIDAQGQELRGEIHELRAAVHALDVRLTRTGA